MAERELPKDLHEKMSTFLTNEKWLERLRTIPEDKARKDKMNVQDLIDKAEMKNKQIRTELNTHLRFDDLLRDVKSGKIKLRRMN